MKKEICQDHLCSICLGVFYDPVMINKCGHIFCHLCIEDTTFYTDKKKCPLCRTEFKQQNIIPDHQLTCLMKQNYEDELQQKKKLIKQKIVYQLKVGNTTHINQQISINKYQWTFYVQPVAGYPPLQTYAEKVEVYLHPTFHPDKITFRANQQVQIKKRGWGTFRLDIKIIWKQNYGSYTDLYHNLSFNPKTQNILQCKLISESK